MDNFHLQCPPMMSDGRLFTDYRTNIRANEHMKLTNNIIRDDDYRVFLQQNTDNILDSQWKNIKETKSCWTNNTVHTYPSRMSYKWFETEKARADNYFTRQMPNVPRTVYPDYRTVDTVASMSMSLSHNS